MTTTRNAAVLLKFMALVMIAGFALTHQAPAQTITWNNKDLPVAGFAYWYDPKIVGDYAGSFVVVGYDDASSLGPLAYWTGDQSGDTPGTLSMEGAAIATEYTAVGGTPAATMVWLSNQGYCCTGVVIDVHQGSQPAQLWSDLAPYIDDIGSTLTFSDAQQYDVGFNPSITSDQIANIESVDMGFSTAPVVEVHQADSGPSSLWYHVGTASVSGEGTYSLTWGPAYQFDAGAHPSVTLCASSSEYIMIEVHEGNSGSLWYSTGLLNGNQIAWNASQQYDVGYRPSVTCAGSDVMEVHQAGNPSGESTGLWYHLAPYSNSSVSWTPALRYDTGCSPTAAVGYYANGNNIDRVFFEAHLQTCGVSSLLYDVGTIPTQQL